MAAGRRPSPRPACGVVAFALAAIGASLLTSRASSARQASHVSGSTPLYLELVVNGLATGRVVRVDARDGHYYIDAPDLRAVHVGVPDEASSPVAVDALPSTRVTYDRYAQRLEIVVPPESLPLQVMHGRSATPRVPVSTAAGFVFNYDLYGETTDGASDASAFLDTRAFGRWGTVSTTGVSTRLGDAAGHAVVERYRRQDTTWRWSDVDRMVTYSAGDVQTGSLPFTTSVRIGGVTIGRDFEVRPDVVTYPVPEFAGRAAVPTTVDLLINGHPSASAQAAPGPFTLQGVPFINGAGTATLVTTDAVGRRVETTMPFYAATTLLARGMVDYSISAGALRRAYGLESFAYGPAVASGVARYGATPFLTVDGRAEGARDRAVGGLGADVRAARFGVVSVAAERSRADAGAGTSWTAGYNYLAPWFSVQLRLVDRSARFADLSTEDFPGRVDGRTGQASIAVRLGDHGTVAGGVFTGRDLSGASQQVVNLSYSHAAVRHGHLLAAVNLRRGGDRSAVLQWLLPFGTRGNVTVSGTAGDGAGGPRVQYVRTAPSAGGLGAHLAYAPGENGDRQADLSWRDSHLQADGGTYDHGGAPRYWGGLSGSAIVVGHSLFLADRVPDAFAIVDAGGREGVPVYFENRLMGRTDGHGRLLVPSVAAYYAGKYAIDPLGLPPDVRVGTTETRVAIGRGSGAIVHFDVSPATSASVVLVDASDRPLPIGAAVTLEETGEVVPVGWDGVVYLEHASATNHLTVVGGNGARCVATFAVADAHDGDASPRRVVCR
ncbi:MAG TPA: fimbria/pilus outer membrane usher protein [Vicinamibacterales bacterium]|jgi:outer membrane usher protein|nr:fimbria/pilus outer membrane usher protein [Vicinamibacterales bacterium]